MSHFLLFFVAELVAVDFPVNGSPANTQQTSGLGFVPVSLVQSI
jgi:hypothetical protein